MKWDEIRCALKYQLKDILVRNGWMPEKMAYYNFPKYAKGDRRLRCYIEACRRGFSQSITGYWIKVETPPKMFPQLGDSCIKRRFKAEFVEGKNDSVKIWISEAKLLSKIEEIHQLTGGGK